MRRTGLLIGAACALSLSVTGALVASPVGAAPGERNRPGDADERLERTALSLGLQVAPKEGSTTARTGAAAVNPYLGLVRDPATVDYAAWAELLASKSTERARSAASARAVEPFVHDEEEPAGASGSNDVRANAERIQRFGTAPGRRAAVRVLGELSPPPSASRTVSTREDQGSIPQATPTGIPARGRTVVVNSRIGDGPHGSRASGNGDFDFYKVTARAGQTLRASTLGGPDLDTVIWLYDADGTEIAINDDAGGSFQSELIHEVTRDGDYYVMVTGFLSFPEDPMDSSSGIGADEEGPYRLTVSTAPVDVDQYAVRLRPGDVLGGTIDGAAGNVLVHKPNGQPRIGSELDATSIYPEKSPLPGGGNATFAYVAEQAGWYTVSTNRGDGRYSLTLEAYRPGHGTAGRQTQRIFLDFDGQRLNTGTFGGRGVTTLSPLSAFLAPWGLPRTSLDPLIDRIVATVRENVQHDLRARGLSKDVRVVVLNSRDHADPFGQAGVSRVVVGGTIEESGVPTIGIAQSIDPGNFERAETALVLLDTLSGPRNDEASLNHYLRPASNRLKFVGTAVGNVTSHEIGHFIGSFHVDQFNPVLNLMDQGGNFPLLYGVGPDGVGGTGDDPDVDFGVDTYNPNEVFTGLEDTLNVSAWGLSDR
jgi:hypothetical protein